MRDFLKKNWLELSIFALVFLILAFFASKTWLQSDDINYVFPSITNDYVAFLKNYIVNYGLFRPLALIYYTLVFKIFTFLPSYIHIFPLSLLLLTSYISNRCFLKQGFSGKQSLYLSLLIFTIPFVTEAYSWFSAQVTIIVLLIYFVEIYLIENDTQKNILQKIFFLQIISVFLYETTLFLGFALSYLLYTKKIIKNKVKLAITFISPLIFYLISKLVIKPRFETRSKFISLSEIYNNWQSFFSGIKTLFSNYYLDHFWRLEIYDGLSYVKNSPLVIGLFFVFFILIIFNIFKKSNSKNQNIIQNQCVFNFWFFTFILSLLPFSWQTNFLPFRLLILPIFSFAICLIYLSKHSFFDFSLKIIAILSIFIFLIIQISMINQYAKQYFFDKKIALEIDQKLENLGFEHPYRSNLYLKNFSYNNVSRLLYGDYIYSLYHNFWSAEALLDLNSGSFANIAIEVPSDNYFTSRNISKIDFFKLRPLTIMSFTDNESCLKGECLKVEAVYQKPY